MRVRVRTMRRRVLLCAHVRACMRARVRAHQGHIQGTFRAHGDIEGKRQPPRQQAKDASMHGSTLGGSCARPPHRATPPPQNALPYLPFLEHARHRRRLALVRGVCAWERQGFGALFELPLRGRRPWRLSRRLFCCLLFRVCMSARACCASVCMFNERSYKHASINT